MSSLSKMRLRRLMVNIEPITDVMVFDGARNQYRHKYSGKQVYGYKLPAGKEPLYPILGASPDPGTPKRRRNWRSSSNDSGRIWVSRTRSCSGSPESRSSSTCRKTMRERTRSRSVGSGRE